VALGTVLVGFAGQALFAGKGSAKKALFCLATALVFLVAICGWYYARNKRVLGKMFPDSYEYALAYEKDVVRASHRPLGWYVPFCSPPAPPVTPQSPLCSGFDLGWVSQPYWSQYWNQHPNYWSQTFATAWVDFFNQRWVTHDRGDHLRNANGRPMTGLAEGSSDVLLGLAVIPTLAMLAGVLYGLWFLVARRKQAWRLELPALAMAGGALAVALTNAVKNALESDGPTKAQYALAATPVLCTLAAIVLAWAWRRSRVARVVVAVDLALLATIIVAQTLVF
jgi:hypothetical protein